MIGNIPVVLSQIALYKDEACHLDAPVTVLVSGELLQGRLLVTSQRIMVLAPNGGVVAKWPDVRAVQMLETSLVVVTSIDNSMILCDDPQYVATLIASSRRRYAPLSAPEPIRPGKRLV